MEATAKTARQESGFHSRSLVSDFMLGLFDGLDNTLWSYGFATILFAGALTAYLPLGVTIILTGWALLGLFITFTSRRKVHVVNIDQQSVVILGSVGLLLAGYMGPAASGPRGLATFLGLVVVTTLCVAVSFLLVGRFRLVRLLELLPYPVICGFMAGVGWLMLNAAVYVTVGQDIGPGLKSLLHDEQGVQRLLITLACGGLLTAWVAKLNRAWALPVASLVIFLGFYAFVLGLGLDQPALVQDGWLFDITVNTKGAVDQLAGLSLSDVDAFFILLAWPQILTIMFLTMLSVSMSLTALVASTHFELDSAEEMRKQGLGNVLCAVVGCPPGFTDVAGSLLYEEVGASSRWMPLISNVVCLLVAVFGTMVIGLLPKVLVAATIFMFAFQMMYKWMYANVRGFQPIDFVIVCIILFMVIFVNFMVGILTGVVLTLLLFVMRYSMISAIQGRYSLRDYRSTVERPSLSNRLLDEHGAGTLIYTLRGFLFFGTANAVLDRIKTDLRRLGSTHKAVLLDFKRVTGIDISALNTFVAVRQYCESLDVRLLYSGVRPDVEERIVALEAVSRSAGRPLIFPELDFALEYLEENVLRAVQSRSGAPTVRRQLEQIIEEPDKIDLLLSSMTRVECRGGDPLFLQGDEETGFYLLESGHLSAYIETSGGHRRRVKKFGPGALVGELSGYTNERRRTATITADEDSVLYHMSSYNLRYLEGANPQLAAAVHELIARTLSSRINYMNRRLLLELE